MEQWLARETDETPYSRLTPEAIIAAVEAAGVRADGRVLALNSYENRVYQVGVEDGEPVIAKFYRPGRWTRAQILEEHGFALELAAAEIPVVAPLVIGGETLLVHAGYPFALYPRRGGRWPDLDTHDDRLWMGRFLGRLHRVGATRAFTARPTLDPANVVAHAAEHILDSDWLPEYLVDRYHALTEAIGERIAGACEAIAPRRQRIHGDCHRGEGPAKAAAPSKRAARPAAVVDVDPVVDAGRRMAAGVPMGNGTAAVEVRFDLSAAPVSGQPFNVEIAVLPQVPAPVLHIEVLPGEGLAVDSVDGPLSIEKVQVGSLARLMLHASSAKPGTRVLGIKVTLDQPSGAEWREFDFPVVVAAPAPAANASAR